MNNYPFGVYLLVCAGITYLVRMLPLVLVKKKINNKFILSFLYYIPYAVLSVMTVPAIFFSTGSVASAVVGTFVALILAYFEKSLVTVAGFACAAVFVSEFVMKYLQM